MIVIGYYSTSSSYNLCHINFKSNNRNLSLIRFLLSEVNMLYLEEDTLFMKNVVAGISSECFMKGVDVSPKGVELLIKNTLLNPDLKFSYISENRKDELTLLADACVETLCGKNLGLRKLYRLQAVYHTRYTSDDNVVREYESLLNLYLEPLLKKIILSKIVDDNKIIDVLKLMVTYTMLLTGLGDPREGDVFQECQCALESVFSLPDMMKMLRVDTSEKKKILNEVAHVTAGIVLYNKIKHRGGTGIENYPYILGSSLDSLSALYLIHTQHAQEAAVASTKLLTDHIYWCETKDGKDTLKCDKPIGLSDEEFTYVFWMSLVQQQVVSYMRRLYLNLRHYDSLMDNWEEKFLSCVRKIDDVISYRIAVPTKLIYPLFIELYDKWKVFYKGIVIVSIYEQVLGYISEFIIFDDIPGKVSDMLLKIEKTDNLMVDCIAKTEGNRTSEEEFNDLMTSIKKNKIDQKELNGPEHDSEDEGTVELIDHDKVNCEVINPTMNEVDSYSIMFAGFDPVYLLESYGVVADISTEIGLLVHNDKYFGFRDVKSAYKFGEDPDKYMGKVIDFVRRHPHYIDILQLRDCMNNFRGQNAFSEREIVYKTIDNKDVQTELHPVPTYIDENYIHSVWQARANFCLQANIYTKRTKSCQTVFSYMKKSIRCQTYPMKHGEQQTMRDNWANTAMPSVFRYGLRGHRESIYHEVSLTLPVEEPHQRIVMAAEAPKVKDASAQTEELLYFDTCLKLKIEPHPLMFYIW